MLTNQKGKETGKMQTSCPPQRQARWEWSLTGSQTPASFTLPLGLAVNTLHTEGLELCLHARHQSNIGHFVRPRVSDRVCDQVGEGDKFELELQRKFLAVLILQQTKL